MNKSQFIDQIAEKTGQSKADCSQLVEAVIETITDALKADDSVSIIGFGNFVVKHRPARMGRNPKTGEPVSISASNQPAFKPGKALKDALN